MQHTTFVFVFARARARVCGCKRDDYGGSYELRTGGAVGEGDVGAWLKEAKLEMGSNAWAGVEDFNWLKKVRAQTQRWQPRRAWWRQLQRRSRRQAARDFHSSNHL
jgi:hypothetical protein